MMEKAPKAHRSVKDASIFRKPSDDPGIRPDTISPAIEGYFRIPPVWIGEEPPPELAVTLDPKVHHDVVIKKKLGCDIEVYVQRDGTFLFDFSAWTLAPSIVIPGFKIDDPRKSYIVPTETINAEEQAEEYAVLRAQVMNAHQAFLTTSELLVKRTSGQMGFPITSWNNYKALSFHAPHYMDSQDNIQYLARNIINNKDQVSGRKSVSRRVLPLDVVERSFELLDQLLSTNETVLIKMVEGIYMSACRCYDKRYGEAITLTWAVCEQLLSTLWEEFLDEAKSKGRMVATRRKKLKGRDFTASSITEILELNGRIDHSLYLLLEATRKSRNKWAHDLREPKEDEVCEAIRTAETLLSHVKGIQLSLQCGGPGSVPSWNIWVWENVRGPFKSP